MPKQNQPKQLTPCEQEEALINKYGSEYEFHKAKRVNVNAGLIAKKQKEEYNRQTGKDFY